MGRRNAGMPNAIPAPITPAEREELNARRPINWDDMGSSARDLWEGRQLRSIRLASTRGEDS